ncbi:acetate/propionate family kinase [Thermodesulfobacteriota bacterium]
MKILVINTGSSSIKYQLFDMDKQTVLAHGLVERIGETKGSLTHEVASGPKKVWEGVLKDHHYGFKRMVDLLLDEEHGIICDKSEISAVGHRVVHGGETFQSPTIIDAKVMEAIRENIPLAPLHNPPNLTGIEVALAIFPDATQVAVFDTAFHQTIPPRAYIYALPYELYRKEKVRRYGFHGTSHSFVAGRCADYLERPLPDLDLITIHLGNGASIAALKNGQCVDTTMGMTPLEGLVMGTRSGDIDPALPFFLADHLKMTLSEIDDLLNNESGLKGICGTNDMREVLKKEEAGDERSRIAIEVYTYRIKKYIGAYFAALGRLDAIVFTGGIGENASKVRELCCKGLNSLRIAIDPNKNISNAKGIRKISPSGSGVKVLVIPTNEELKIALETKRVVENQ